MKFLVSSVAIAIVIFFAGVFASSTVVDDAFAAWAITSAIGGVVASLSLLRGK